MSMFEVVPDNPNEEIIPATGTRNTCNSSNKTEFGERAMQEGFPSPIVRLVVADGKAYSSYESFIDAVINYTDSEVEKVKQGEERKKKRVETIQKAVQVYSKYEDIEKIFEQELYATYNTTAVTLFDLVRLCTDKEALNLDLYLCPAFSIILQIKSEFVAKAVQQCLKMWSSNKYLKEVLDDYLKRSGTDITNKQSVAWAKSKIISLLPKNLQNEVSPDEYKLFRVIQIENSSKRLSVSDFDSVEDWMNFGVYCETYMDCNTPYLAANALSVDRVLQHDVFKAQVMPFVFKPAKTFRKAFAHTLSSAGRRYFDSKDEVTARKEEFKDLLESEKDVASLVLSADMSKLPKDDFDWNSFTKSKPEPQPKQSLQKPAQPAKQPVKAAQQPVQKKQQPTPKQSSALSAPAKGQSQSYAPRATGVQKKSTDFRFDTSALKDKPINPSMVVGGLHLVLAFIMFLVLGASGGILCTVGLLVSQGGFMRKMSNKDKWIQPMAAGYIITLLSLIFL